jgi:hypothetical protein
MDLLQAAAGSPATRCCLTITSPRDGAAAAHECVPGRRTLAAITGAGTAGGLAARLGVPLTPSPPVRASTRTSNPATRPAAGSAT